MTKYNTGNPVGSADPRDLHDNAQVFDEQVNNVSSPTVVDRLGRVRTTLASQLGYNFKGDYAAGIKLSSYNDIIRYSGEFYGPSAVATLPYTTTVTTPDSDTNLVARGDAVLRQELSGDPASGFGALLVKGSAIHVDTIAKMQALPGLQFGTKVSVAGSEFLFDGSGFKNISGFISPDAFNVPTDGTSSARSAINDCIAFAKANGIKRIRIVPRIYSLPAGTETVSDYGVRVHADPAIDIQGLYSVMIDGCEGLEIDATGATFITDSGCPFVGYRSLDCVFKGGAFQVSDTEGNVITNQASAVSWIRSINCRGKRITVDGYYRNLVAYRAPGCGFDDWCQSINALYYNYYQASALDVSLGRDPVETEHKTVGVYAKGGRYGNYFNDNGVFILCQSEDCSPSGNIASHFKTERGNYRVLDCTVKETSVQNGGDIINGITAQRTQAVTADLIGVSIQGCDVQGCYKSFALGGLDGFTFAGNKARGYYQTGFALISQKLGATDYRLKNGTITGNEAGSMADNSTRAATGNDKNAGLQLEENNGLAFENLIVAGNTVDALGDNTTKTPDYGVYVEASQGGIITGPNAFAENLTNVLPAWLYSQRLAKNTVAFSSQGTTASPALIDKKYALGGSVRVFNSSVALPAAETGMEIFICATSSTVKIFADGATDSATSSDTIYVSGGGSTQRNIQFNGPGTVKLTCAVSGQWSLAPDGGTTVSVTP
jgi:hypothetical protein